MGVQHKDWAVQLWKERVYDKQDKVDPAHMEVWYSMAIGFALGLGYEPDNAHKIAKAISNAGYL